MSAILGTEREIGSQAKFVNFNRWFEEAYRTYFDRLFEFALTVTHDQKLSEDVVSEVFLNLWRMRDKTAGIKDLGAYLFVSVRNQAVKEVANDPYKFLSSDFELTMKRIEGLTPEDLLIEKELLNSIKQSIEELPDHCKIVYDLIKVKHMKYSEAAAELGISESTIKNQLSKALSRIKQVVKVHLGKSD